MKKLLTLAGTLSAHFVFGQLTVNNTTLTPAQCVQNVLAGQGVTITNVTFNGAPGNTITPQVGTFNAPGTNVPIATGILMGTGDVQVALGPNSQGGATLGSGASGSDPDLNAISTNTLYDQAILEFDFVPIGDTIEFRYSFASEEYNEYVCSGFNDVFGFFISGPGIAGPYTNGAENIALVPNTNTAVAINTVNLGVAGSSGTAANCTAIDPNWASYNVYYINNTAQFTQYDGMTVSLTAKAVVQCGQTYHIKLAIADVGDGSFDSGVFLEAGSLTSQGVDVTVTTVTGDSTIIEGCADATFTFTRPDTTGDLTINFDISGNAINGTDYSFITDSVFFASGEDSVQLVVTPLADGITEGMDTLVITVYTISPCGDTIPKEANLYIIDPVPIVPDAGSDTLVACPGQTINLIGSATGGNGTMTYAWSTGDSTATTGVAPTTTSDYILTVTDICGYTNTDTVTVIVPPFPPLTLSGNDVTVVCPNDPATLEVSGIGGGTPPYTYSWSNGDTDTVTTVNVSSTTTFTFTLTDNCGLDSTISVDAIVPVYNPLAIAITNAQLCLGDELIVTPSVSGGAGGNTFSWTGPATSFTINQSSGATQFVDPTDGIYIVDVIDQCGNAAADTANYTFVGCDLIIPNVFTPNGDGSNDVWHIENVEYQPGTKVVIFNRWGVVVYENDNYQNNWDGGDLHDGTYFYIVYPARTEQGPFNGTVTILGND